MTFDTGDTVVWDWGQGTACGTIKERFTKSVTKSLQGTSVTRNASPETPAYLIEQEDGAQVLKLCTELRAADT